MAVKILVVDDEPEVHETLGNLFRGKGYEVVSALNGKEALEKVKKENPAVMLLDLIMPVMNGWEILRQLKKMDSPVRVITVTGVDDKPTLERIKEMGSRNYVIKPFDFSELTKKVEEAAKGLS